MDYLPGNIDNLFNGKESATAGASVILGESYDDTIRTVGVLHLYNQLRHHNVYGIVVCIFQWRDCIWKEQTLGFGLCETYYSAAHFIQCINEEDEATCLIFLG
jgi:hypothetical protein